MSKRVIYKCDICLREVEAIKQIWVQITYPIYEPVKPMLGGCFDEDCGFDDSILIDVCRECSNKCKLVCNEAIRKAILKEGSCLDSNPWIDDPLNPKRVAIGIKETKVEEISDEMAPCDGMGYGCGTLTFRGRPCEACQRDYRDDPDAFK